MGIVMKHSCLLGLFLIVLLTLLGCRTKTVYVPVKQTTRETVTVRDTVVDTRLAYYRDTVITPDTISFLSNPYSFSWAETKEGKLHHSLSSWPDTFIPVKTLYIEKIIVDSIPAPYPVEVAVYKEKDLSGWQRIRMRLGEFALIGLIIGIGFIFFKKTV